MLMQSGCYFVPIMQFFSCYSRFAVHLFVTYICYIQMSFVMHICPLYNCHKHILRINTIDVKTNLRRFGYRPQDEVCKKIKVCTVDHHKGSP